MCESLATLIAIAVEKRGLTIRETAKQEVLIHLEQVTKNYQMGEVLVEALGGVSIDIYKGELLVILGASGSGKSTMLNILGGMDRVSSGRIIVNNRDISYANDKELTYYRKDEIGFVFQFYNLIPDLTAGENIALAAELAKDPLPVDKVLKEVGLLHKKDHFPSQMSGGEQQRISIARAIVKRPRILLCDEPTGALDYQTGKTILGLLEKIARDTRTGHIVGHLNFLPFCNEMLNEFLSGKLDVSVFSVAYIKENPNIIRRYNSPGEYYLYLSSAAVDPEYLRTLLFGMLVNAYGEILLRLAKKEMYITVLVANALTREGIKIGNYFKMMTGIISAPQNNIYISASLTDFLKCLKKPLRNELSTRYKNLEPFFYKLKSSN